VHGETDDDLMRAVRDGRLDALGGLFERHHQRMYRFFRRSIVDGAACEDLVQSLFIRILDYSASYRGGSFTSWMYRVAINLRTDHVRREQRGGPRLVLSDEEAPELAATTTGLDHARLRASLDALRPSERDVLILTRFEGLSYDQAAAVLGCSVGALKVRVHRALKSLRRCYDERGGAPWA
jgi:RNA polymerase sigma-70 factor, ECF subfamily